MGNSPKSQKINAPKGTRDLYPEDLLRQRYITNAWRDASINCGFEEIAGPTFESTELYSVKSGDGILSELFQAFSGKSEKEVEQVQSTAQAPYALRPEFTPTLARMYAAKSKELRKPCKWFTAGPYFRAERPQRGRLREFLQWNVDVIGLPGEDDSADTKALMDRDVIECAITLFSELGLNDETLKIHFFHRDMWDYLLTTIGVNKNKLDSWYSWIDRFYKLRPETRIQEATDFGASSEQIHSITSLMLSAKNIGTTSLLADKEMLEKANAGLFNAPSVTQQILSPVYSQLSTTAKQWAVGDMSIVRGLAYYTGTVFEAIADGERAVAGGGRYDNLIELFGGPPTPACGFGMGDVVLGNLLDDKGLMPTGAELMDAVAKPQASIRPIAFVITSDESNDALVHTLVTNLRRGIESESYQSRDDRKPWDRDRYAIQPMHTRISYKTSKHYDDAKKQHARFFIEIKAPDQVELTNMDTRESLGEFCIDPTHEKYVGRSINEHL